MTHHGIRTEPLFIYNRAVQKTAIDRQAIVHAACQTVATPKRARAIAPLPKLKTNFPFLARIRPNFISPLAYPIRLNRPDSTRDQNSRRREHTPHFQGFI